MNARISAVRIQTKCSVFMRLSLLLLTFIYPLELVFKQIIHTFCACWRTSSACIHVRFSFSFISTLSHAHGVCVVVFVCANGGQSARIEHFGDQEFMRWGCCHFARTDQSEQMKKKEYMGNNTNNASKTQLHYTNFACPEKNWWFRNEWIICCLFHLFAQNINADIMCRFKHFFLWLLPLL